jgi:uncharacterized membrane protein HdeD (DUF308 family)
MQELTGTPLAVFIGVTLIMFGGAAFVTGRAIADTWRPAWQNIMYGVLLGVADRLLGFLLFGGELLSLTGYVLDTAVLIAITLVAHRATLAHKMANQYPWLYERAGLFGWREKAR